MMDYKKKTEQIDLLNQILHFSTYDFKFGFLKEDNLKINSVVGFCDTQSRSSGVELGLRTSQIFIQIFQNNYYFSGDIGQK
jgi:hypothetical protein